MQDRFRFRCWDKEIKKMYYDIQNMSGYLDLNIMDNIGFYDNFGILLQESDEDYIIMQCIGLKDIIKIITLFHLVKQLKIVISNNSNALKKKTRS